MVTPLFGSVRARTPIQIVRKNFKTVAIDNSPVRGIEIVSTPKSNKVSPRFDHQKEA